MHKQIVVYFLSAVAVFTVFAAFALPAARASAYYDDGYYYGSGYYHSSGPAYRSYVYPGVRVYPDSNDTNYSSYNISGHFVYVNGVAYWDNGTGDNQYYNSQNQYQGPGYRCYPSSGYSNPNNFSFQGHIAYTSDGTAYWQNDGPSNSSSSYNSCP